MLKGDLEEKVQLIAKKLVTSNILSLEDYEPNLILVGCEDGYINLFQLESKKLKKVYKKQTGDIYYLKYIGKYKRGYFLSSSYDCTVALWDLKKDSAIRVFTGMKPYVRPLEMSMALGYDHIIAGSIYGLLYVMNVNSGVVVNKCCITDDGKPSEANCIWCLECLRNPDYQNLLLIGVRCGKIVMWDINASKLFKSYHEHEADVISLLYYKFDLFLSTSFDGVIKLWSINCSTSISTFKHSSNIFLSKISIQDEIIAFTSKDCKISILDLQSFQIVKTHKTKEIINFFEILKKSKYHMVGIQYQSKNIFLFSLNK